MTTPGFSTGSALVRVSPPSRLTGASASAHYGPESLGDLLAYSPLSQVEDTDVSLRAEKLTGTPIADLLNEVYNIGLTWRLAAQMLGVSVIALNKWRAGGGISAGYERRLRGLVAFCELARERGYRDLQAWLHSRPMDHPRLTRADVYRAGGGDELLAGIADETLLDRWLPRWLDAVPTLRVVQSLDSDGSILLRVPDLDLIAVGRDLDLAREELLSEVHEYVSEFPTLASASNHAANAQLVRRIESLSQDGLRRLLFG